MVKALKELRLDKKRFILTVDKGMAIVVLYRYDYIIKAMDLLAEGDTYRPEALAGIAQLVEQQTFM